MMIDPVELTRPTSFPSPIAEIASWTRLQPPQANLAHLHEVAVAVVAEVTVAGSENTFEPKGEKELAVRLSGNQDCCLRVRDLKMKKTKKRERLERK